jgi:hypothetical protein
MREVEEVILCNNVGVVGVPIDLVGVPIDLVGVPIALVGVLIALVGVPIGVVNVSGVPVSEYLGDGKDLHGSWLILPLLCFDKVGVDCFDENGENVTVSSEPLRGLK